MRSAPKPPDIPPPAPPPPMLQSPQGLAAQDTVRQRVAGANGYGGTIITGPAGLTAPATTGNNRLLGG